MSGPDLPWIRWFASRDLVAGMALALGLLAWGATGVHSVAPEEVALVLRLGRLVGAGAGAIRPPGLLITLPRPLDEVVRVPARRVQEVEVDAFAPGQAGFTDPDRAGVVGYLLTGDRNLVQARLIARFRVADPAAWALGGDDPVGVVRAVVQAVAVRSFGERGVEGVLGQERDALATALLIRCQAELERAQVGAELVAVEFVELGPMTEVRESFEAVQASFIQAETQVREARAWRAQALPQAEATAARRRSEAAADAARRRAEVGGVIDRLILLEEGSSLAAWRRQVPEVLERAGAVHLVPPPPPGGYQGLRVLLPAPAPEGSP